MNDREFMMDEVANDERIRLGDTEIWVFENSVENSGGMGGMTGGGMKDEMQLPHPMHIHGVQFQVLRRTQTI